MDLEREDEENKIQFTPALVGDIRFENISFSYGTRVDVFSNFNFMIKKGEITAIIGESGSGKTTLAVLLQKLYQQNQGAIYIGAYNIGHFDNQSLRRLVASVPQQLDLFAGNVIENIAVGEFEPDMQRIVDICNALGLLGFIESLPAGFATWLGENGAQLSGGQKQRIAIARALYRDPEILILDEATSSLDSESEHYVQQAIFNLRDQGKTIILIAHRLSTVVMADKIVVMKQGNIIEEGAHKYLYNNRGAYYQMWQKQIPQHIVEPINTIS
jgi:ATP-binding cassette, subfamily C, bacteriocin exporter